MEILKRALCRKTAFGDNFKILLSAAAIIGIAVIISAQFSIPTLFDADGYYHIRMAQFITQYGPYLDFHWTRYSILAEHFADKDFLYHLLIIPFTFLPNIILGAKIAAAIFAAGLYLVFFWLLRRYCRRQLILPFLIIFFMAPHFLTALCYPRPKIFIMALTLLFTHFLIKKNWRAVFWITVVYSLTHATGPFLAVFAILCEAARYLDEKKLEIRTILAAAAGSIAGMILHPHFPNNLLIFYLNAVLTPIYGLKWGLELGAELFPISTRDFILEYPFILGGVMTMLALAVSSQAKVRTGTKMWMVMAGFFFVLSFFSRYYIIHGYPLMLIALSAYLSDWWNTSGHVFGALRHKRFVRLALFLSVGVIFAWTGTHTYRSFRNSSSSEMYHNLHYERAAAWMSDNIPAGELIFHSNWSDGQYFIGLNPQNDYFVAMDALYMYYWNPEKYKLYRDISFGRTRDPYLALKDEFGVRYGYAGKNYFSGLIEQIRPDKRFDILAEDGMGVVFRLR